MLRSRYIIEVETSAEVELKGIDFDANKSCYMHVVSYLWLVSWRIALVFVSMSRTRFVPFSKIGCKSSDEKVSLFKIWIVSSGQKNIKKGQETFNTVPNISN